MLNEKKIAIIGAGNMGDALISGLIGSESSAPNNIICTDVRQDKIDEIDDLRNLLDLALESAAEQI